MAGKTESFILFLEIILLKDRIGLGIQYWRLLRQNEKL